MDRDTALVLQGRRDVFFGPPCSVLQQSGAIRESLEVCWICAHLQASIRAMPRIQECLTLVLESAPSDASFSTMRKRAHRRNHSTGELEVVVALKRHPLCLLRLFEPAAFPLRGEIPFAKLAFLLRHLFPLARQPRRTRLALAAPARTPLPPQRLGKALL